VATGTDDYNVAVAMLREKMAALASGRNQPDTVRMNQLFDLVIDVDCLKGNPSLNDVKVIVEKRLRPRFGQMLARRVTNQEVRKYVQQRLADKKTGTGKVSRGFANATINKELVYLRRAFKLGFTETPRLVLQVPRFEMLDTSRNVRQGIVSHEAYQKIRDLLSPHGRIATVIAYHTGARKTEIRAILKDGIDFEAGRINLPGFSTKNERPRYIPIYGDMAAEIEIAISKGSPECPFLIQCAGRQASEWAWNTNWATACKKAGVPTALFHDLRRTALTNMIEAGFSETEAMAVSGHRTRVVFDRYHIVSAQRLRDLGVKLAAHLKMKEEDLALAQMFNPPHTIICDEARGRQQ
jgi:integrase